MNQTQAPFKIDKDFWTMEISIPFSDLGIITLEEGSSWGLNICRNREGGLQNSSSWAAVGRDFHNPGKFNTLIFGNFKNWYRKEILDCKKESEKFKNTLEKFKTKEKKLNKKLLNVNLSLQKLSLKNISFKKIDDFLPFYYKVQSIKKRLKEIEEEVEVISALKNIK